jgi:hypothetical protein
MAAVTVDNVQHLVQGNLRVKVAQVDIAANGDTWISGLNTIKNCSVAGPSTTSIGVTYSGGTVTFVTAGAEANCKVRVEGY